MNALPSLRIRMPLQEQGPSGPVQEAMRWVDEAAQYNNSDALYILAQTSFYGNYSWPRNFEQAFQYYKRLGELNGNASAMYMLGLMYSTGIGRAAKPDQAKALLYYTFAAVRGHTRAEMTVAARHHAGVGTPKSCEAACKFYKPVADKVMEWYRSGPPGGMVWVQQPYRIADDSGGVYGEGASVVSSGMNALRAHPNSDAYASIEDIIEYLDLMSQKGDFKASFNLGRIYYEGQRGLERDLHLARKYFLTVVAKYWKKDGRIVENFKPGLDKTASKAAGYIGRMYMRGEGVEQNFDRAKSWFERGISHGDPQSQYCMGLLLMNGYGGSQNVAKAIELFKAAAEQDHSPAQVEMGSLYLDQGQPDDLRIAHDYFELAARYGHIEATYYLAEMIHHGIGRDKACGQALAYYKSVAERADPLVSSWLEANQAYDDGDFELALLSYLGAAEQGYEKAQNNVGYLLDSQQSSVQLPGWLVRRKPTHGLLHNPSLGLIEWTRSSRQGNVDSLVKVGDYYLKGIGAEQDVDKAVQCYTGASEYHQSAQALYNLGWMHENGVGLNQDYHLAKRYYDAALVTNEEAYLPVTLSLLKLRARSAWNSFTNGEINSIQDEPGMGPR
jgi:SEL1 protein